MWQKSDGSTRRWVKNFRWHAKRKQDGQCCWLVASLEFADKNIHTETRGRKPLVLPKEVKAERLKILRNRARLVMRLRELMLAPLDSQDVNEIIKIGSKIGLMKERIAELGGVPSSW